MDLKGGIRPSGAPTGAMSTLGGTLSLIAQNNNNNNPLGVSPPQALDMG
jgi:hypothetical protein